VCAMRRRDMRGVKRGAFRHASSRRCAARAQHMPAVLVRRPAKRPERLRCRAPRAAPPCYSPCQTCRRERERDALFFFFFFFFSACRRISQQSVIAPPRQHTEADMRSPLASRRLPVRVCRQRAGEVAFHSLPERQTASVRTNVLHTPEDRVVV